MQLKVPNMKRGIETNRTLKTEHIKTVKYVKTIKSTNKMIRYKIRKNINIIDEVNPK